MFVFKMTIIVLSLATGQPMARVRAIARFDDAAACFAKAEKAVVILHRHYEGRAAFAVKCEKEGPTT